MLLDRVVVPVANPDDATDTYRSLREHLEEELGEIILLYVVEKAGGAPDKAGIEQRERHAEETFQAFRAASTGELPLETRIVYDTDVANAIIDLAGELDATAIAFRSRGGGRLLDFLSGSVRVDLLQNTDRPVLVLPR